MIETGWKSFENENRTTETHPARDGLEFGCKEDFLAGGQDASFSPFLMGLVRRIENRLDSIRNYTQVSRGKFSDSEFGKDYYRVIIEDIEKMEVVLNVLIDYTKLRIPVKKKNMICNIVEEILKKHQVKLREKGIKVLTRFQNNLPETIVPDGQLGYMISSVLQYAMIVTPSNSNVVVSTKSLPIEKGTQGAKVLFKEDEKYVEISLIFEVRQGRSGPGSRGGITKREESPNILLRFVREVAVRHHGIMKMGTNEKGTKKLISLRFPVERRKWCAVSRRTG